MHRWASKLRPTGLPGWLRVEKSLYLGPVFLHDMFGVEMAAPREKVETYARASRKTLHKFPGDEWIVFGVEHPYLRGHKLSEMMSGIVKYAVV
jgi:hypothetical protein